MTEEGGHSMSSPRPRGTSSNHTTAQGAELPTDQPGEKAPNTQRHTQNMVEGRKERRRPMTRLHPLSEETYKQMWMLRYQQHMGQISFLELLDKYEVILGISPHTEAG
jgi:hypothetical protein